MKMSSGSSCVRAECARNAGFRYASAWCEAGQCFSTIMAHLFPFFSLSFFRQAQSSAQLMDLFQVRWTQGQCTMGTHGS